MLLCLQNIKKQLQRQGDVLWCRVMFNQQSKSHKFLVSKTERSRKSQFVDLIHCGSRIFAEKMTSIKKEKNFFHVISIPYIFTWTQIIFPFIISSFPQNILMCYFLIFYSYLNLKYLIIHADWILSLAPTCFALAHSNVWGMHVRLCLSICVSVFSCAEVQGVFTLCCGHESSEITVTPTDSWGVTGLHSAWHLSLR